MRKIVKSSSLSWEEVDILKRILNVDQLPEFIILDGVEV